MRVGGELLSIIMANREYMPASAKKNATNMRGTPINSARLGLMPGRQLHHENESALTGCPVRRVSSDTRSPLFYDILKHHSSVLAGARHISQETHDGK